VVIPVCTRESPRRAHSAPLLAALAMIAVPHAAAQGQPASAEPSVAVSVQQPRAFGHVIGDRLEQRISLQAPQGFTLDPRSLPRAGRTGLWLDLASPRLTSNGSRYRLTLDYQVVNVPEQVRTIDLPALDVVFNGRGGQARASIDEWPVTIAPITPTFVLARAGLTQIQPDARPTTPDGKRYMRLTLLWAALFIALGAGSLAQRRGIPWLRHDARPFARAARDIAKLSRLPPDPTTYRRGLQRLHRAFDAAAGHAVFGEHLASFFTAHPELLGMRRDIEQFYVDSQREFFGTRSGAASLGAVLALAIRCRDAEAAAARQPPAGDPTPQRRTHAV
jgi:mxaA protein